jgi:hypothetical protein
VPVALDRRVAYFAEHLSENIAKTDEGYLICRNAVIGRSGYQTYRVKELTDPEGLLKEYSYAPDDELKVWRDPSEVFSAATIASFEGKTFTLTHPSELLQVQNDNRHSQGHVQNVRRGTEPLDDGNIPLLADVVVKGPEAIQAIEEGQRELSCGYLYTLAREGYRWDQRNILGNHVALVPKGRAGEARIVDAAPEPAKERTPVKFNLKNIFGMGFKEFAKDAKPEELSEAIDALNATTAETVTTATVDNKKKKLVRVGKTRNGADVFEMVALDESEVVKDDKDTENQAAKDRKILHDALDRQLDAKENEEKERTEDEEKALSALKDLFTKKGEDADPDKEAKDAAEKEAKDAAEKEAKDAAEKEAADAAEKEKEEAGDADIVRPEPVLAAGDLPKKAFDEAVQIAVAKSTLTLLKTLKPLIARANDKKAIAAFDTAIQNATEVLKPAAAGAGSYDAVRKAAAKSSVTDAAKDFKPRVSLAQKEAQEADAAYAGVMKKQRDKSVSIGVRR